MYRLIIHVDDVPQHNYHRVTVVMGAANGHEEASCDKQLDITLICSCSADLICSCACKYSGASIQPYVLCIWEHSTYRIGRHREHDDND